MLCLTQLPALLVSLEQKKAPAPIGWRFQRTARRQYLSYLCFFGTAASKTLIKAIYTATGIQNLLLAGIKRVTLRTNIDVEITTSRRARLYNVSTTTSCSDVFVLWMYISFHNEAPYLWYRHSILSSTAPGSGQLAGQKIGGHLNRRSTIRKTPLKLLQCRHSPTLHQLIIS